VKLEVDLLERWFETVDGVHPQARAGQGVDEAGDLGPGDGRVADVPVVLALSVDAGDGVHRQGGDDVVGVHLDPDRCAAGAGELGGCALREHPTVFEDDHAVAQPLGFCEVVGAQDHGPVPAGSQAGDEVADLPRSHGVQGGGRFVEEEDIGVVEQDPRQRQALPHPRGEAARTLVGPTAELEAAEECVDAGLETCAGEGEQVGGEAQVVPGGEAVVDRGVGGEHTQAPTHLRTVGVGVEAVDADPACGRGEQARHEADRRGLACTVVTEQAEHLAATDRQLQPVERSHLTEGPRHAVQQDHGALPRPGCTLVVRHHRHDAPRPFHPPLPQLTPATGNGSRVAGGSEVLVEYGILGPLELLHAGEPVRVSAGRQRELFALLLAEAGRTVSTSRLVDALWGDDPPENPDNALQQLIHHARRVLGATAAQVLVTVPGGYRLETPPEAVDAHRFERLTAEGRRALEAGDPAAATATLSAAAALWRGPALDGIEAAWALEEARRLEELRVTAWEDRVDADLALGRHAALVAELEHLVTAEPMRERARGQLMLALAGSGRQADALRVYDDGRRRLAEELGIDPSPQLQRIHADVLAQRVPAGTGTVHPLTVGPRGQRQHPAPLLPTPAGSFVGRTHELAQLGELLTSERVVTVLGPGGAGKSRLALEVARASAATTPDLTVRLVELAPVTEADALPAALAAGLDVAGSRDVPVDEALRSTLRTGRTLLLLDNCEHLLPAVSELTHDLVVSCPELTVLATSREPLGVSGEVVWPLPTLPVPPAEVRTRADAEAYAAFRLLTDRVAEVAPTFELTDAEVPDATRIVRHLDGLPLAIELAAARVRVLSLAEIAARLHDRFGLLSGGRRSAPQRHRALWDTMEWSWSLLDEPDRRAWMAASVPAGPFPASLLEVLLDAVDADLDVLDALTRLTDRSLLSIHDRGAPTRYRMLETLREFGVRRLAETGQEPVVREAHARAVEEVVASSDRWAATEWAVDLQTQRAWLPEARAALRWRAERGDRRGVQRLAARLGWLWYLTALAPEGLRWLDGALGPLAGIDPEEVEPDAVLWAAALRVNEAPDDLGLRWAQLAVDLVEGQVPAAMARAVAATHRALTGDLDGASAEIRREPAHEGWIGGYWRLLEGQIYALEGRASRSQPVLDAAERLLVDHGAWFGVWTSATLVQLAQLRGDEDDVRRVSSRALSVCAHQDAPELEVEIRCTLAMVDAALGRDGEVEEQLRRAAAIADRTGIAMSRALVATARGYARWRHGRNAEAARSFQEALELHDRAGQSFGRPFTLWCLGHLALHEGDLLEAERLHTAALQEAHHRGDGDGIACGLEGLAAVTTADGRAGLGARLLGGAAARRATMGADDPILSRSQAAAAHAQLLRLLGQDVFAAQFTAGAEADPGWETGPSARLRRPLDDAGR
jgi:predicted ATPase/DNA-binding SARP family transcriptional activator